MRKTYAVACGLTIVVLILSLSCQKKTRTSPYGTSSSHLTGFACLSCHYDGGKNKTVLTVAGSVLDEARAATQTESIVELYTKPKGEGKLVATIYTDRLGNFYTHDKIDFSNGLYPTLLGTPGVKEDTKHMVRPVFKGDCNSCHGYNAERLGID